MSPRHVLGRSARRPTASPRRVATIVRARDPASFAGADGSAAVWRLPDSSGEEPARVWSEKVGRGVQAVAAAAGRVAIAPAGTGPTALQLRDAADDYASFRKLEPAPPPDDAEACGGCGLWSGAWGSACAVCASGCVTNACAIAGRRVFAGGYDRTLSSWDVD